MAQRLHLSRPSIIMIDTLPGMQGRPAIPMHAQIINIAPCACQLINITVRCILLLRQHQGSTVALHRSLHRLPIVLLPSCLLQQLICPKSCVPLVRCEPSCVLPQVVTALLLLPPIWAHAKCSRPICAVFSIEGVGVQGCQGGVADALWLR